MIRFIVALIVISTVVCAAALADETSSGGSKPKYRPASDHAPSDLYNLSVLGGRAAWVASPGGGAKSGLQVQELAADGALERAGVQIGDVIIGTPRAFGDDAYLELAPKILDAQASKKGSTLQLSLWRDNKATAVKAEVAGIGGGVKSWPSGAVRDEIVRLSLASLAAQQESEGSYGGNYEATVKVVMTSLAGLAFLSAGHSAASGDYRVNVVEAADYVVANIGQCGCRVQNGVTRSFLHWSLAIGGMFLAELQVASPLQNVNEKLPVVRDLIQAGVLASGGIGHGPGGRCELGYTEFSAITNLCLMALGAIENAGHAASKAKVDAMLGYLEACAGDTGGIGYASEQGYRGNGSTGRTAGALVAMHAAGRTSHGLYKRSSQWFRQHQNNVVEGHASPTMHYLTSAMACWLLGKSDWKKFGETYLHEMTMLRCADGSFTARPTEETAKLKYNPDGGHGTCYTTASWVIVLCLDTEYLSACLGKKAKKGKRTTIGK